MKRRKCIRKLWPIYPLQWWIGSACRMTFVAVRQSHISRLYLRIVRHTNWWKSFQVIQYFHNWYLLSHVHVVPVLSCRLFSRALTRSVSRSHSANASWTCRRTFLCLSLSLPLFLFSRVLEMCCDTWSLRSWSCYCKYIAMETFLCVSLTWLATATLVCVKYNRWWWNCIKSNVYIPQTHTHTNNCKWWRLRFHCSNILLIWI